MLSANARAFSVESLLAKKNEDLNAGKEDGIYLRAPLLQQIGPSSPPTFQHTRTNNFGVKQEIKVELCQNELWESFYRLGTEMIVTKSGRRMFPVLRIKVDGLDPNKLYRVSVTLRPVDKFKYRYMYHSSKWMVAGNGDSILPHQVYEYSELPLNGATLMNQVTSFEKIKLTNSETPKSNQISLVSMQKFKPCIHITAVDDAPKSSKQDITAEFSQTAFMAVTAYQNQAITRLKIARNPFAKGFREANKNRSSLEEMLATLGMIQPSALGKPRRKSKQNVTCCTQQVNSIIPPWCKGGQKVPVPQPTASNTTSFNSYTDDVDLQGLNCLSQPTTFFIEDFSPPSTTSSCVITTTTATTLPEERLQQPLKCHLFPFSVLEKTQPNVTPATNNSNIPISLFDQHRGGTATPSPPRHLAFTFGHVICPQPTRCINNTSQFLSPFFPSPFLSDSTRNGTSLCHQIINQRSSHIISFAKF